MTKQNLKMDDESVKEILTELTLSYISQSGDISENEWLINAFEKNLPSFSKKEAQRLCDNIASEMERTDALWTDIKNSEKSGYNAEAWLFHQTRQSLLKNNGWEIRSYISALKDSMERVNNGFLKEAFDIYAVDTWGQHIKKNDDDDVDDRLPHEVLKNLRHIILEECENLIQLGKNPLLLHNKDINMLAYHFSKNATVMGIGTMIFMAELCLANKLQQRGLSFENREKLVNALNAGKDAGIRKVIETTLKICAERGFIPILAKSTPLAVFIALSFIAVETAKIFAKYNNGEMTGWKAFNELGKVSAVVTCGAFLDVKGTLVGTSIGTSVCPGIGTLVGGMVGSFIFSTMGQKITPIVYERSVNLLNNMAGTLITACSANNVNKIFEIPSTIYNSYNRLKVWN